MAAGTIGDFGAGEHARDLFHSSASIQPDNADFCSSADYPFLHQQMVVGKTRYLRLVGHAKHLVGQRQLSELDANCFTDATTDAAVYLVEHYSSRKFRSVGYG